jgi:hypothetical protein
VKRRKTWGDCVEREREKRRKLRMIVINWTHETYQETARDELVLRRERM